MSVAVTPPNECEIPKFGAETTESVNLEESYNVGVPEQLETLNQFETTLATSDESQTHIMPLENVSSPSTEVLIEESPLLTEPAEPLARTTENFVLDNTVPPVVVSAAVIEKKVTMESSTQCEAEEKQKVNDVIDELERNVSILRKENEALGRRENELVHQLETSEKLIRDLRKEVNQFKEQGNVHQQLEELQNAMVVVVSPSL